MRVRCTVAASRRLPTLLAILLFAASAAGSAPQPGDLEQEDLDAGPALTDLEQRFAEAERCFFACPEEETFALFSALIEDLSRAVRIDPGCGGPRIDLLADALAYRARLDFNLGRLAEVQADLDRLLELSPGFRFDPDLVSPRLLETYEEMRSQRIGSLELLVHPSDAAVTVDGCPVDPFAGPAPLPAGQRHVRVERPGFTPFEERVEIAPDRTRTLQADLERSSPALLVVADQSGVEVAIDGRTLGRGGKERPVWVEVAPGEHEVEVSKEGFRTARRVVSISDPIDYHLEVELIPTAGFVTLVGTESPASVRIDGVEASPEARDRDRWRFRVRPGEHRIFVRGPAGLWASTFSVADQEELELEPRLRPGLTLLAVLGGDRLAAEQLVARLTESDDRLQRWNFLDRSAAASELIEPHGLETQRLRAMAATGRTRSAEVDWRGLQARASENLDGSVFFVAVLSDDLMAAHADVWFVPALPGPPNPDVRRLELDDAASLDALLAALDRPIQFERPWLGALLVDSEAAQGALVAAVDAEGPAATAGLTAGDRVVAMGGESVATAGDARRAIDSLPPGTELRLGVEGRGGGREVELRLGTSPAALPHNSPDLIYAAASAQLAQASVAESVPEWLLQLDLGILYLNGGAWEEGFQALRVVRAPSTTGLGQATADYWLGFALQAIGPAYFDQARQAFERAAEVPGARFEHHGGPLVGPRARARLAELGGAGDG